jgi:hypothetical protein
VARAVENGDAAAMTPPEEAEHERRHALLIGSTGEALKPGRGSWQPFAAAVTYTPETA